MDCRSRTVGTLYAGAWRAEANTLIQTNLVSDISGLAIITDPRLRNPWGMSHTRQRCTGHDCPLGSRRIDKSASRRLREEAGQGSNGHHQTDAGFVPSLNREQIDGEIRSEPVANVGEKE